MLLAFAGNWDATALGTLGLAVATFASLIFARRALNKTQDQIELGQQQLAQTQREIELSRTEVEEAHRPVVVPVVIARPPDLMPQSVGRTRRTFPDRPSVSEAGVLALPVQNIGSGPALCVVASIERLDEQGDLYRGAIEHQTPGKVAGIGKDQTVHIEIGYHGWEERWNFQLKLAYEDVAGKHWKTVAKYDPERRRYEDVSIGAAAIQRA